MTRGVVYLNQGDKCMVRMLVSATSLREHYSGPIALLAVGPQRDWFIESFKELGAKIVTVPNDPPIPPLVRKARLHEVTPFDVTMFIDADTLVLKPIDAYFDKIEEYKFCTGEFAGWKTTGGTMSRRIRGFAPVAPQYVQPALDYGKATNTGVFGFTKDAPILEEWKDIAEKGWRANCSRIPDEVGCQMLLPKYRHWLAPVEWGTSVKYGQVTDDVIIAHYHGRKHTHPFPLCALWKQAYWKLFYSLRGKARREFSKFWKDRRLHRYVRRDCSKDLTIVTAVNKKYLGKLKANLPLWMKTEGVMEYPMICYVNGIPLDDPSLDFIRSRAELIEWDFPEAANTRELMLTAFVLGAARDVKTDYWLKLDADATPKPEGFTGLAYHLDIPRNAWNKSIFGHRCGYTKSKQGYADKHFLNILDEWWEDRTGEKPLFPPDIPVGERYGHKRLASYVCLQKTAFTRRCAALCGDRLPVPSHDTYCWYCAERLRDESWGRTNFKKIFSP